MTVEPEVKSFWAMIAFCIIILVVVVAGVPPIVEYVTGPPKGIVELCKDATPDWKTSCIAWNQKLLKSDIEEYEKLDKLTTLTDRQLARWRELQTEIATLRGK
jgi:hypothetical protein